MIPAFKAFPLFLEIELNVFLRLSVFSVSPFVSIVLGFQVQIRKTHREQNLAKKRAEALDEAEAAAVGAPRGAGALPCELPQGPGAPSGGPLDLGGKDLQQLMIALASGNSEAELQVRRSSFEFVSFCLGTACLCICLSLQGCCGCLSLCVFLSLMMVSLLSSSLCICVCLCL